MLTVCLRRWQPVAYLESQSALCKPAAARLCSRSCKSRRRRMTLCGTPVGACTLISGQIHAMQHAGTCEGHMRMCPCMSCDALHSHSCEETPRSECSNSKHGERHQSTLEAVGHRCNLASMPRGPDDPQVPPDLKVCVITHLILYIQTPRDAH